MMAGVNDLRSIAGGEAIPGVDGLDCAVLDQYSLAVKHLLALDGGDHLAGADEYGHR
jgi:hypothetical protein